MFRQMKKDLQVIFERDPAAKSTWEVLLCYPGLHAIWLHKIAHKLYKKIPVIWGTTGTTEVVAQRWKGQINENAKAPAYWNVFPELNHNELSCFDLHSSTKILSEKFSIVLLEDKKDEPRIQKRTAVLKKILRTNNFNIQEIKLLNHSESEKIFSSVLLANWSSYYLAKKYFIEPESVPLVEKFKKLIK